MDVVVFEGPPKTEQVLWPTHCVQESWGAEMHKDLKVISIFLFLDILGILFRFFSEISRYSRHYLILNSNIRLSTKSFMTHPTIRL